MELAALRYARFQAWHRYYWISFSVSRRRDEWEPLLGAAVVRRAHVLQLAQSRIARLQKASG